MGTKTRSSKQMYKAKIFLSWELQNFIFIILRPEDRRELVEMEEERVFAIEEGESTDSDNSGGRRPLIQEPEFSRTKQQGCGRINKHAGNVPSLDGIKLVLECFDLVLSIILFMMFSELQQYTTNLSSPGLFLYYHIQIFCHVNIGLYIYFIIFHLS